MPVLHVTKLENLRVGRNSGVFDDVPEFDAALGLELFQLRRVLKLLAVLNNITQRGLHLSLECLRNNCL